MRKLFVFLLVALIITPCIALAHPGGTDSNGGHTDHSTGEYHYHHGYPAHEHKDMDGDGKKDCPYDFKDATDHRTGSSNSNSSNKTTSKTSTATTVQKTDVKKSDSKDDWIALLGLLFVYGVPIIWFVVTIVVDSNGAPKKKKK